MPHSTNILLRGLALMRYYITACFAYIKSSRAITVSVTAHHTRAMPSIFDFCRFNAIDYWQLATRRHANIT